MNHTKEGSQSGMSLSRKAKHTHHKESGIADKIEDAAQDFFGKLNKRADVKDLLGRLADSPKTTTPEEISNTNDSGTK